MKFVVCSDIHIQNGGMFSRPVGNGFTTRAETSFRFLEYLSTLSADAYLIAGDIFSQKSAVPTPLYNRALDAFTRLASFVPVLAIPGNHDRYMQLDDTHSLYSLSKAVPNFHVLECKSDTLVPFDFHDDVQVFGLHAGRDFPKPDRYRDGGFRILLLHENVMGAKYSSGRDVTKGVSARAVLKFASDSGMDAVFCGDIHAGQVMGAVKVLETFRLSKSSQRVFALNPPKIFLPGAPFQMDFGDEGGSRGFLWLDTDKRTVQHQRWSEGPVYVTLDDEWCETCGPSPVWEDNTFYRFRVNRFRTEAEDICKQELAGRAIVEYVPSKEEDFRFSESEKHSYRDMVGAYVGQFQTDLPKDRLICEGLRIFDCASEEVENAGG